MNRVLRRLTRPWCSHEYVERTRKGRLIVACVGCGKPLHDATPAQPPPPRERLEALLRSGRSASP